MSALDETFNQAMLDVYASAKQECDYDASSFLSVVNEEGGLRAAKALLRTATVSDCFEALRKCQRLDLTMEAVILKHQWQPLFSDEELAIARHRLNAAGWKTPPAW